MKIKMKKQTNTIKMKNSGIIVILMLVMIVLPCGSLIWTATVKENHILNRDREYQAAEKTYRDRLREFLGQEGYDNSGINMTRIVTAADSKDGGEKSNEAWEYTILIYHKKINRLDMTELSELMTQIVNIDFPVNDCIVHHEFIKS